MKQRDTDPFEVPMRETSTMEIPQTLSCPVQLLSYMSKGSGGGSKVTYEFQPVDMIIPDILHDVPMHHPLRHSNELAPFHVSLNANKVQNVRMGYCLPEDGFLAKLLKRIVKAASKVAGKTSLMLTFLIFGMSSCAATLRVFTATRCPL